MKIRRIYIYGLGSSSKKTLYKVLNILHNKNFTWRTGRKLIDVEFSPFVDNEIKTIIIDYDEYKTKEYHYNCVSFLSLTDTLQELQNDRMFNKTKGDIAINFRKALSNINEFEQLLDLFFLGESKWKHY